MRWLRTLSVIITAIFFLVAGVLFASRNTTPYAIDLLILELPEISIALLMLSSLLVGITAGWLLSLPAYIRLKSAQLRSAKALKLAQKELDSLRISGLKDKPNE